MVTDILEKDFRKRIIDILKWTKYYRRHVNFNFIGFFWWDIKD